MFASIYALNNVSTWPSVIKHSWMFDTGCVSCMCATEEQCFRFICVSCSGVKQNNLLLELGSVAFCPIILHNSTLLIFQTRESL